MKNTFDVSRLSARIGEWVTDSVLTPDTAIQIGIIALAFAIGSIVTRMVQAQVTDRINALQIAPRLTEILHSLVRLLRPLTTLILVVIGGHVIALEPLSFGNALCSSVSKLLFAWVLVRISVQFIGNKFSRNIFAVVIWGIAALSIFGILDPTMAVLDSFGVDLGKFRLSALTVIKGVLALFALMYGALFLASFFERKIGQAASLTPSSRVLISKVVRGLLILAAILIGITTAGIDLSLLAVFSGAVGLGVGFGLQRGMSNLFSGMMLLIDQSIKPGDIIEMLTPDNKMSTFGWVQYMGSRYTEIVTRDNKSFLIPNEQLITNQVVNWSHGDTLVRMEVKFTTHYNSDPHLVRKITAQAAAKPSRVVATPAPLCHVFAFADSGIEFVLRFWIRDAEKGVTNIKGEVLLAIWDALKENNIRIPYPHMQVIMDKA
mgnify:CR=1 FL=1